MRDAIFLGLVIVFFALATVFVATCERIVGQASAGRRALSFEDALGLVLAVAVLAYLVYALLAPEKLG